MIYDSIIPTRWRSLIQVHKLSDISKEQAASLFSYVFGNLPQLSRKTLHRISTVFMGNSYFVSDLAEGKCQLHHAWSKGRASLFECMAPSRMMFGWSLGGESEAFTHITPKRRRNSRWVAWWVQQMKMRLATWAVARPLQVAKSQCMPLGQKRDCATVRLPWGRRSQNDSPIERSDLKFSDRATLFPNQIKWIVWWF